MQEHADLIVLRDKLRAFAEARDWNQFHSPKNLSMALMVEAAELMEHFQWLTEKQSAELPADDLHAVGEELADILLYLVRLADSLGIDLRDAALKKMDKNALKYPAELVRGSAKKPRATEDPATIRDMHSSGGLPRKAAGNILARGEEHTQGGGGE